MSKAEEILKKYDPEFEDLLWLKDVLSAMQELCSIAFEAGVSYASNQWISTNYPPNKQQFLDTLFKETE